MIFMNLFLNNLFLVLMLSVVFFSCVKKDTRWSDIDNVDKVSYEIFSNKDQTFGYAILKAGKPVIMQKTVPGMSGGAGFGNIEDAEAVASLVVFKIKSGAFPPTVTKVELDSMGIQ